MSEWKQFFEADVLRILGSEEFDLREPHHFGHPFVTPYQLAVAFERDNRELCQRFGKKIGEGNGMENLPTYIAHELSRLILSEGEDCPVEAAWLSGTQLPSIRYRHAGESKQGTPNPTHHGYSLYRLKATANT